MKLIFLCVGVLLLVVLAVEAKNSLVNSLRGSVETAAEEALIEALKAELIKIVGDDPNKASEMLTNSGMGQGILHISDESQKKRRRSTDASPVVQMHGMGDFANDPSGMVPLAKSISKYLGGAYVLNVQIGDNSIEDILNGFIMNLDDQVDYFAKVVRNDTQLSRGFNAVGYSQGNLVIRGYIERYNSPPVFNFISMHGPLAGVASFPGCALENTYCKLFAEVLGAFAYYPMIQQHLAQANYFRDPRKIDKYLAGDKFLADMNREVDSSTVFDSASYASNLNSLKSVCLVKALGDTVVIPNDSEWFGAYEDGSFGDVLTFDQTSWYKSDSFGLKTLNENNKVFFNTTDGDHLKFSTDFLLDLVGIYFV